MTPVLERTEIFPIGSLQPVRWVPYYMRVSDRTVAYSLKLTCDQSAHHLSSRMVGIGTVEINVMSYEHQSLRATDQPVLSDGSSPWSHSCASAYTRRLPISLRFICPLPNKYKARRQLLFQYLFMILYRYSKYLCCKLLLHDANQTFSRRTCTFIRPAGASRPGSNRSLSICGSVQSCQPPRGSVTRMYVVLRVDNYSITLVSYSFTL